MSTEMVGFTEEYCHLLDLLKEGIYVVDSKGDYIFANRAVLEMVDAKLEDVLTYNIYRLKEKNIFDEDNTVAIEAIEKKKVTTSVRHIAYRERNYDEMAIATPILDGSSGEVLYVIVEMWEMDAFRKSYQEGINIEELEGVFEEIDSGDIVAKSSKMRSLLRTAQNIARFDTTVLIMGETGTGKQVIANFIQQHGVYAERPMVAVNCASIPESLFEAELFGYEKGSFTGALKEGKAGFIEAAGDGILFLDEINSLPLHMQGKLLRVLEEKRYHRVGNVRENVVQCKIIVASNKDLKECVEDGSFREDLYYRLSVITLHVPPLRERKEDILPLAQSFFNYYSAKYGIRKAISKKVEDQLMAYDWPGNVRELKNMIEKLLLLADPWNPVINEIPEEIMFPLKMFPVGEAQLAADGEKVDHTETDKIQLEGLSLKEIVDAYEAEVIKKAVKETGNTYKAAKLLKTSQPTISRKMIKYAIKTEKD